MMEMPLDGAKYDSLLIFTVTGEVKSVEFLFSCTCYQKTNSKHKIMSLSLWRYDEIFPSPLLRHEPLQDKQVETTITQS